MGTPPPIEFASLGMADSLILMVLALVVFGPRRLPQIGRQIGKLMYEFRKASNDFKFQMEEELRLSEESDRRKKEEAERMRTMALAAPAQTVEAEAGIGAVESPTASPYPGETEYPPQYPPESAENPQPVVTLPRINPPAVGEQVSATQPGQVAAPAEAPAEARIGDEAKSEIADSAIGQEEPNTGPATEPTTPGTEPVNQHG
jgi:sec-independent protein translocase protein TatB